MNIQSYLLNSIFTHKSCRYAVEGALNGFATDAAIGNLSPSEIVLFSERNSEAMNAPDNDEYGSINQDDYDTWAGEATLVQWGDGKYGDQGWIKYNRHNAGSNYVFADGHVKWMRWGQARNLSVSRPCGALPRLPTRPSSRKGAKVMTKPFAALFVRGLRRRACRIAAPNRLRRLPPCRPMSAPSRHKSKKRSNLSQSSGPKRGSKAGRTASIEAAQKTGFSATIGA